MPDNFASQATGLTSPAEDAFVITPDDANDLANSTRAIYVGVSGSLKVTTVKGTTVTFDNVPVGVMPVRARRVWSNGTSAGSLVGLV